MACRRRRAATEESRWHNGTPRRPGASAGVARSPRDAYRINCRCLQAGDMSVMAHACPCPAPFCHFFVYFFILSSRIVRGRPQSPAPTTTRGITPCGRKNAAPRCASTAGRNPGSGVWRLSLNVMAHSLAGGNIDGTETGGLRRRESSARHDARFLLQEFSGMREAEEVRSAQRCRCAPEDGLLSRRRQSLVRRIMNAEGA